MIILRPIKERRKKRSSPAPLGAGVTETRGRRASLFDRPKYNMYSPFAFFFFFYGNAATEMTSATAHGES